MNLPLNPPYAAGGQIVGTVTTPKGPELPLPTSAVRALQEYVGCNSYHIQRVAAMCSSGPQAFFFFYLGTKSFEQTGKLMDAVNALTVDERQLLREFATRYPSLEPADFFQPHRAKRVIDAVQAKVPGIGADVVVRASVAMEEPMERLIATHYDLTVEKARNLLLEIATASKSPNWKQGSETEQKFAALSKRLAAAREQLRHRRTESAAAEVYHLEGQLSALRAS